MEESVFDKLVHDISHDERKNLLEQIGQNAAVSGEPLAEEYSGGEAVDLEDVYRKLDIFSRIIVFFKMLFSGRRRDEVLEHELLANIARDIQKKSSGIMNFSQRTFLPAFCEEVRMLRDNVQPFVPPLTEASGRNKGDFIAFLAGLYMEDIQNRLIRETDPYYQVAARKGQAVFTPEQWEDRENMDVPPSSELPDGDVKRMMEGALEDLMEIIPADSRTFLYQDMKVLYHLVTLSRYPFDKLISAFASGPAGTPAACPMSRLKDQVMKLAEIMWNMRTPPSAFLLRTLFLFYGGDKSREALEKEVVRQISAAGRALQSIREINKRVPWLLIARYVSQNLNYQCAVSGGAEDWFVLLKLFWKNRIDALYKDFSAQRKEKELRREIRSLFDPLAVLPVANYRFSVDEKMLEGAFSLSLSLVKTFLLSVFPGDMNRYLKTLLIDGVFYKEDNRKEFTDGYNAVQKAAGILEKFEARLAPKGDVAEAVAANLKEYAPALIKRRKIQGILRETGLDAEYLLQTVQGGFVSLARVVNGILYGEVGGKYDTLSNLGDLGGRANAEFRKGLDESLRKINAANTLLQKLILIEKGWQEAGNKENKELKA
ncbi:MAG: DUF5312 domain-containing protein [Spirochaetales bacterium]|jgi:hypothetical protein|nr:DUF5312 domain-containing protein [Spirochaetales bacterium]